MKNIIILLSLTLILKACTSSFNPTDEMNKIDSTISKGEADSVSGQGGKYKYWTKSGKMIKLNVVDASYEYFGKEEYYFRENGNVFAHKKLEWCPPNGTDYKAIIAYNDTSIVYEEYWLGNEKVTKSEMQKKLNQSGYSIENDILKDSETKKVKAFLNVQDFTKRYSVANPKKEPSNDIDSQNETEKISKQQQEVKTLYFQQNWGTFPHQKTSYQIDFEGEKITISYTYADNKPMIEKGVFKDGKIVIGDCSDCYELRSDGICVSNPETGEPDCYAFIKEKSTTTIDEILNQENSINQSSDNLVTLKEAQLILLDAGEKKMNIYLGKPDYGEMLAYGAGAVAVYVNRVKDGGQVKDLAVGFQNGRIVSVQALITKYHRK
jgi:hypothetical protein